MDSIFRILCLLIGYAVGCFQTAYIVGKLFGKIDIRDHGSGNAGMTNVTRVMGAKPGMVVFACDFLKAVIGYYICTLIFSGSGTFIPGSLSLGLPGFWGGRSIELFSLPGLYGGLGVILGHNFPVYMGFKGGKGVAATMGVLFSFNIWVGLICYICGLAGVLATRYISVASLIITGLFPFCMLLFGFSTETVILGFIIAALAYYQHRSNIQRLLKGTENKFSIKKKDR